MNHQKIYKQIIFNARNENRVKLRKNKPNYVYYERHHILPSCLGGNNDKSNLVLLTAKEHFVCHKLLTYIYRGNRKIACAYHKMTYNVTTHFNKTSRDYSYAKELISNTPVSEETKLKIKLANSGEKNPFYGKHHTEETKLKLKKTPEQKEHLRRIMDGENNHQFGKKGELSPNWKRKFSKETIEKLRLTNTGEKNPCFGRNGDRHPMFNKQHTEEVKLKIKNSLNSIESKQKRKETMIKNMVECEHCNKLLFKTIYTRFHRNNCKLKKS